MLRLRRRRFPRRRGLRAAEDPLVYPGASDLYGDGTDTDCDGMDGQDRDGDGHPANLPSSHELYDCNDNDADIHPGAADIGGNGVDENCDSASICDGNDDDGDNYPTNAEICDGQDNDCDDLD